jgi:hypothetical protein
VKWAYNTGGRINSSPSILGNSIFVSTYAGSVWRLTATTATRSGAQYSEPGFRARRELLRERLDRRQAAVHDLTLGRRLRAVGERRARGLALERQLVGYATPARRPGRVFFGGFDGRVRALRAAPALLWSRALGGRFLGRRSSPASTSSPRTSSAARMRCVPDGKVCWHLDIGKYSPGIVTDRHYFFTLNGIVQAWHGRPSPQILELQRRQRASEAAGDDGAKGSNAVAQSSRAPARRATSYEHPRRARPRQVARSSS